jgi:hypothetical protein
MSSTFEERLQETSEWIFGRVWPDGHSRIRLAIETLGWVINDFRVTFQEHMEIRHRSNAPEFYYTDRFYKISDWDPKRYHKLLAEYQSHIVLVEDLALEMTRYGNYIASLVRDEIDPAYRLDEGVLLINKQVLLSYEVHRPEFIEEDFSDGEPYRDSNQFREDRVKRRLSAKRTLTEGYFDKEDEP